MIKRRILFFTVCCFAVGATIADELPANLRQILEIRQVPQDTLSIAVLDLETRATLIEWHGSRPRNPGSTIKLLTTLVALDLLGPAYVWYTDVYAHGDIDGGRLKGDLMIKGRGDPYLVTERVWQLLRRVRQTGINEIEGDLLIDDSYFSIGKEDPASFDRQPLRAYNVPPNALLMNFKVVRYWFEPASESNSVRVWLDPSLDNLTIENRISLSPGRCRGYQRGITISANEAIDRMTLSGNFPSGCKRFAMDRTALSHNEFVYGLFTSLWRESGGKFDGSWRNAEIVADIEPLLSFASLPLADIIGKINKHSNNVMARQLLLTLSTEILGIPGTEPGGQQVILQWLDRNGLHFESLRLENGAGLSREARITANDLVSMLAFAWQQPYMPEYVSSLSLAGLDGTSRRRFDDRALDGKAHLKTGTLDHVSALAGYLQAKSGRRFALAVLHNHEGIHRGPGEEAQEALLRWLYQQ